MNNIECIELGNIEYEKYLAILEEKQKKILLNPQLVYLLTCSHPAVYTYGSGLEKRKGKPKQGLIDFDLSLAHSLNFPLHKIKRGGGLTFHHPGQLICYPLFSLTHHKKNLQTFMLRLLNTFCSSLNELTQTQNFHYKGDFLGLWHADQKVGSIGLGLNRFITQHGLALNLNSYEEATSTPLCGMNKKTYSSIKELGYEINRQELSSNVQKKLKSLFE